jgi:hypothetical protein
MDSTPPEHGSSEALDSLRRFRSSIENLAASERLVVVVLGPGGVAGDGNADFDKRFKVRQFILDSRPQDFALFPEDTIPDEVVNAGLLRRSEKELVKLADVVLALVPPGAHVSGVFTEVVDFVGLAGVAEKLWLFRPSDRVDRSKATYSYSEQVAYESMDESRLVNYPPDTWRTCTYIRPKSVEIIDQVRRVKLARGG